MDTAVMVSPDTSLTKALRLLPGVRGSAHRVMTKVDVLSGLGEKSGAATETV
jgi:lipoate synthase